MTNLNLRKQKIKRRLLFYLVLLAVLLAVLPLVIYFILEMIGKAYVASSIGRVGITWLVCFSLCMVGFTRVLSIYFQFRKVTFPSEEIFEVTCEKLVLCGAGSVRFIKIKTNVGEFIYLPIKGLGLTRKELQGKYQRKWILLKCYAGTRLVKEMKPQN